MKKNRWLLVSLLLLITACGQTQNREREEIKLEVAVFEGGFGSEWVEEVAKEYMKLNKHIDIEVQASLDIHQQLQLKFLAEDVPNLINPGPSFDILGAIAKDEILSLNNYLEEMDYNNEIKWIQTFEPSQFNLIKAGKIYGIPIVSATGHLWWYNESLFEELGIYPPKDWDDLEVLNRVAIEHNISLFSVPGKYPGYAFYGIYIPLVQRIAGTSVLESAYRFQPDAWSHDAFLKAAQHIARMRDWGYFSEGSNSFSHMDAQAKLFQNETLFVTAGTWLEGEMKDIIPEDFKLRALNIPIYNSKGLDKDAIPISSGWGGAWYIPKKADNIEETVKFLKFLSSKDQVIAMVENRGIASVVKGTQEAIQSEALKSASELVSSSESIFYPTAIQDTHPEFIQSIINKFQSLMLGEVTPEEFVDYIILKAEEMSEAQ